MNKYETLISLMPWSYSRLKTFRMCKYQFFLKYIEEEDDKPKFFTEYGKFMHSILEKVYNGELNKSEAKQSYLIGFRQNVGDTAPNQKIRTDYYQQGKEYWEKFLLPEEKVIAVEEQLKFKLDGQTFIGFTDLLLEDEKGLILQDNKTRILKRSDDKKIRKWDVEFSEFAQQLYLYSIGIREKYGEFPYRIQFNCFRNNTIVKEDFDEKILIKVGQWALSTIEEIKHEEEWTPNIDWFQCNHICGLSHVCEYAQTNFKK